MPNCRLPDDDKKLAKWARVESPTWSEIRSDVMAFWTKKRGYWVQLRLLKEWAKAKERSEIARKNGKKGGRPSKTQRVIPENPSGYSGVSKSEPRKKLSTLTTTTTNNTKAATVSLDAAREAAAFGNDVASQMVRDICAWQPGMPEDRAREWLANLCQLQGGDAVLDAYTTLKTNLAAGKPIARPLQAWSKIAQGERRERANGAPKSAHERSMERGRSFRALLKIPTHANPGSISREE